MKNKKSIKEPEPIFSGSLRMRQTFDIPAEEAVKLKYQDIPTWDSAGHMVLISTLEDVFDIMMDTEDIIDFNSFEKGKEILMKYDVEF